MLGLHHCQNCIECNKMQYIIISCNICISKTLTDNVIILSSVGERGWGDVTMRGGSRW